MYPRINSLYSKHNRSDSATYIADKYTPAYPRHTRDPAIWGPHLWNYLHYSAANFPEYPTEEEIEKMYHWLCTLHVTMPCGECSKHYQGHINRNRSRLRSICSRRDSLFRFLVDIHNDVNKRNGKPIMRYQDAKERYGCN